MSMNAEHPIEDVKHNYLLEFGSKELNDFFEAKYGLASKRSSTLTSEHFADLVHLLGPVAVSRICDDLISHADLLVSLLSCISIV